MSLGSRGSQFGSHDSELAFGSKGYKTQRPFVFHLSLSSAVLVQLLLPALLLPFGSFTFPGRVKPA